MKKEYIVYKLSECAKQACRIDNELFTKYNVKRGLRNEDGTGVLVGLTKIGNVVGYERTDQGLKAIPGKLFYRGYDLDDIAHALLRENVSVLRKWLTCCCRVNFLTANNWLRSRNSSMTICRWTRRRP